MAAYEFGPFRVTEHELKRHGQRVRIDPRPLAVLRYLIVRRDALVSDEQLRISVWEGDHIAHGTIQKAISRLRIVLDDTDPPQRGSRTRRTPFLGVLLCGMEDGRCRWSLLLATSEGSLRFDRCDRMTTSVGQNSPEDADLAPPEARPLMIMHACTVLEWNLRVEHTISETTFCHWETESGQNGQKVALQPAVRVKCVGWPSALHVHRSGLLCRRAAHALIELSSDCQHRVHSDE